MFVITFLHLFLTHFDKKKSVFFAYPCTPSPPHVSFTAKVKRDRREKIFLLLNQKGKHPTNRSNDEKKKIDEKKKRLVVDRGKQCLLAKQGSLIFSVGAYLATGYEKKGSFFYYPFRFCLTLSDQETRWEYLIYLLPA